MNHQEFDHYIQQDAVLDLLIFSEAMDDVLLALNEGRLHPRKHLPAEPRSFGGASLGVAENVSFSAETGARLADIANHGRRLIAALDHLLED